MRRASSSATLPAPPHDAEAAERRRPEVSTLALSCSAGSVRGVRTVLPWSKLGAPWLELVMERAAVGSQLGDLEAAFSDAALEFARSRSCRPADAAAVDCGGVRGCVRRCGWASGYRPTPLTLGLLAQRRATFLALLSSDRPQSASIRRRPPRAGSGVPSLAGPVANAPGRRSGYYADARPARRGNALLRQTGSTAGPVLLGVRPGGRFVPAPRSKR
jgi:hypothetical protein